MAKTARRNKSGRFVKGGGQPKALVRTKTRTITKYKTRRAPAKVTRRRARRGGGSGGVTAGKIIVGGLALGALVGSQNMAPKAITDQVDKLPGVKTFGRVAVVGLGVGALAKYTRVLGRFTPWGKALGVIGLAALAVKVGQDNTGFKFVGAYDDDYDDDVIADVEG